MHQQQQPTQYAYPQQQTTPLVANTMLRQLPFMKPGQKIFLEFLEQGRPFYYEVERQVSQWERPGEEGVVLNGPQYQEFMMKMMIRQSQQQQRVMIGGGMQQVEQQQESSVQAVSHGSMNNDGSYGSGQQRQQGLVQGLQNMPFYQEVCPQQQNVTQQQLMSQLSPQPQYSGNSGIPPQYKQGPPGANLFIFHLPNEWNDNDLLHFFNTFSLGKIVSVRIMTDKENGRSKGFGFVSYDNPRSAELAIQVINGKQALGKRLKVELKKGGIGPPHLQTESYNDYQGSQSHGKRSQSRGPSGGQSQKKGSQYPPQLGQKAGDEMSTSTQYSNLTNMIYEGTQTNSTISQPQQMMMSTQQDSMSTNSFFGNQRTPHHA